MRAFVIITLLFSTVVYAISFPLKILRACIDYDNDVVTVSWSPPTDACGSFEKHIIYGSENFGPFHKLAEIGDLNISEFPHTLTVQNTSWRYYITTYTVCGGVDSLMSDTIEVDITYPTNIDLDSISYDVVSQEVTAGWKANPSKDTKHYELFDYSSGNGDLLGKTEQLNFNITNIRSGRFPVALATLDSCNLSSLLSTPHETTYLNGIIDSCSKTINFKWSLYVGWNNIDSQALFLSKNKQGFMKVNSFNGTKTEFLFSGFELGDTMNFLIRSYKGNKSTSSNTKTFETRRLVVPKKLDLRLIDVEDNMLKIRWLCKDQKDIKEFNVYCSENSSTFRKTETVLTNLNSNNYLITDKNNNPNNQSFLYFVSCIDKCNNIIISSDTSASLFLDTNNVVIHNKYVGWENGVSSYSIEKKDGFTWNTVKDATKPFLANDINDLSGCIRVVAKENNSRDGENTAHSNVVCKAKLFKYYVTTAIKPEGNNTRFVVKGEGIDRAQSVFYIYSRWGELIKKGDLDQSWDGTYRGKKVSQGHYLYVVKVFGLNGEFQQSKGTVYVVE